MLRAVFRTIEYLAIITAVAIAAIALFSFFSPESTFKIVVIKSSSMEPTLHAGGTALIQKSNIYHMGDIITFKRVGEEDQIVTHRIVETLQDDSAETYRVKGDANTSPDNDLVPKDQVLGKVLFGLPFLGYARKFLDTLPGIILIIFVPTTWIVVKEILAIRRHLKDNRGENEIK